MGIYIKSFFTFLIVGIVSYFLSEFFRKRDENKKDKKDK